MDDDGQSLIGRTGPAKLIRRLLSGRFLRDERPRWVRDVAAVDVPDGRVLVFDPVCYDVRNPEGLHVFATTLQGPPGRVAIHLQFTGSQVSAAEIRWSDDAEDSREVAGEVGVDSATLALAPVLGLERRWRIGGARNRSAVMVSYSLPEPERESAGRRATEVLRAHGFRLTREGPNVRFELPLEDSDLSRANEALTSASVQAKAWAEMPHSCALIHDGIVQDAFAVLEDNGAPYLIAFTPGWGDGTYVWYSLRKSGRIVGFSCTLLDPNE